MILVPKMLKRINSYTDDDYIRVKKLEANIENEIANEMEDYDFLYPHLDDPEFSYKIAKHKEFYENRSGLRYQILF